MNQEGNQRLREWVEEEKSKKEIHTAKKKTVKIKLLFILWNFSSFCGLSRNTLIFLKKWNENLTKLGWLIFLSYCLISSSFYSRFIIDDGEISLIFYLGFWSNLALVGRATTIDRRSPSSTTDCAHRIKYMCLKPNLYPLRTNTLSIVDIVGLLLQKKKIA